MPQAPTSPERIGDASAEPSIGLPRAAWPDPIALRVLAVILGLGSANGARRLVLREQIPHVVLGRKIVVRAHALDAWLAEQETTSKAFPLPVPKPSAFAVALLTRGRRPGRVAAEARS